MHADANAHGDAVRKESGDPLRMMIDTIPTLAWACRPDATAEFFNQRWLDYTGLSFEEALGWGWKIPVHPEDLEKLMDTWRGLLASGEPCEAEARLRRFDGAYRWFLVRAVPVRDEQGSVLRWYGTNTDIEELKRAEACWPEESAARDDGQRMCAGNHPGGVVSTHRRDHEWLALRDCVSRSERHSTAAWGRAQPARQL